MPVLDRVLDETLRLHPPFFQLARVAMQPFQYGGYTIPAGHFVAISPGAVQRYLRPSPYHHQTLCLRSPLVLVLVLLLLLLLRVLVVVLVVVLLLVIVIVIVMVMVMVMVVMVMVVLMLVFMLFLLLLRFL